MDEEIKEQLDKEISSELTALSNTEIGSDAYKIMVESISKLIDKRNDIEKNDLEKQLQETNELNESYKMNNDKKLAEENLKDQKIKNAISIASILIPVFVTIWGTYKTLKFEETGTITTSMGRGFISKLIPKK